MRARCCRDSRHTASSSRSTSLQMPQLLQRVGRRRRPGRAQGGEEEDDRQAGRQAGLDGPACRDGETLPACQLAKRINN